MSMLSPFRLGDLFHVVANALSLTYSHFMEFLSTTGQDTLSPWIAATIINPTNAFIEWLSSQVNPLWQWVADIVNSPTFHDVVEGLMESLPSFRLTTLRGLQRAAGLEDDRPLTAAMETV